MKAPGPLWRFALLAGALAVSGVGVATLLVRSGADASVTQDDASVPGVIDAVFAGERLWLLSEAGRLVSLRPEAPEVEEAAIPGRILAICRSGTVPMALAEDAKHGSWTLYAHTAGKWNAGRSVPADHNVLIGFGCDARGAVIATDRRLLAVEGGAVREMKLSTPLEPAIVRTTLFADGESAWLGFNNGEWGGGLVRIGRADGKVAAIERNSSGTLCGGPLNGACDPVNAIVASPRDPACVVAAVGLVHMMEHGRIVEVCGDAVRRLYYKADDHRPPHPRKGADEPDSTIAFFGAAPAGADIWVVGTDGLYRFAATGDPAFSVLPKFENRGGYRVSFAMPGVALVLTGVNGKASMSGAVPLMAAR